MHFFKYIISGLLNTFVALTIIYFLYTILKLDILITNTIAYLVGFFFNFHLMKKFVFRGSKKLEKKLIQYGLAFVLSVSLSVAFLSILIKAYPSYLYVIQPLTMLAYSLGMYFLSKKIFMGNKVK